MVLLTESSCWQEPPPPSCSCSCGGHQLCARRPAGGASRPRPLLPLATALQPGRGQPRTRRLPGEQLLRRRLQQRPYPPRPLPSVTLCCSAASAAAAWSSGGRQRHPVRRQVLRRLAGRRHRAADRQLPLHPAEKEAAVSSSSRGVTSAAVRLTSGTVGEAATAGDAAAWGDGPVQQPVTVQCSVALTTGRVCADRAAAECPPVSRQASKSVERCAAQRQSRHRDRQSDGR